MIKITEQPIDVQSVLQSVQDVDCGACLLFLGTTRRMTGVQITEKLSYECYREMALASMRKLRQQAQESWSVSHCSIVHRIGEVPPGQVSVAIAVSSPHRGDAFAAGQWLIDTLKQAVPIWKQEHYADGRTCWSHPAGAETPSCTPSHHPPACGRDSISESVRPVASNSPSDQRSSRVPDG